VSKSHTIYVIVDASGKYVDTARWWTVWGFQVVRCKRHFRPAAAAAAQALGWQVEYRAQEEP